MRTGQVLFTVALTLIVITAMIIVGVPTLATTDQDRQAILALGSSALGVLVTLGAQAFFREQKEKRKNGDVDGPP
jgi:hypothetical protein